MGDVAIVKKCCIVVVRLCSTIRKWFDVLQQQMMRCGCGAKSDVN